MKFTLNELHACAWREVRYRTRCYPRWVREGRVKQTVADKEIAMMTAIRDMLEEQIKAGRQLSLFEDQ